MIDCASIKLTVIIDVITASMRTKCVFDFLVGRNLCECADGLADGHAA
jgi:hypothetical protein